MIFIISTNTKRRLLKKRCWKNMKFEELQLYKNFDELARDMLELAKEIMPDQLFFLSTFSDDQQVILKLSNEQSNILVTEGTVLNLNSAICNRIDFEKNQPLVYEDIQKESDLNKIKEVLERANVRSYLGIPISLVNGEKFGTLCAINDEQSQFDSRSINLLQRIVRMFSYYLELERYSYRDDLTGLYNRRYLTKFFEDPPKRDGGIFFLDLDGFKKINDVYGHDAGDSVLKEIAFRLQTFANKQKDAFAVRLGGDEFILAFFHSYNEEEWREKAQQALNHLSDWDTGYELSTSIGIVTYAEEDHIKLTTLLKNADEALYRAKTTGKNTFKFFQEEKLK